MDVFIIRLKDNNELIGFVEGIYENKVKTVYPHYIKYFADSHSLGIMPYCPLSDESNFDIDLNRVEFMVLPKKAVRKKYIDMIREDCADNVVSIVPDTLMAEGNQTQH